MATKTLSISEEAYNELIKLKEANESFSQVILRLTSKRGSPEVFLKIIQDINQDDPSGLADLANKIENVYLGRLQRKSPNIDL